MTLGARAAAAPRAEAGCTRCGQLPQGARLGGERRTRRSAAAASRARRVWAERRRASRRDDLGPFRVDRRLRVGENALLFGDGG